MAKEIEEAGVCDSLHSKTIRNPSSAHDVWPNERRKNCPVLVSIVLVSIG